MNCRQVKDALPLYVGSDLTDAERALVEVHLGECGECQVQLERLQGIFAPLRGLADADVAVPDAEAMWSGIARQMNWTPQEQTPRLARRPRPWVQTALRVAAVFCLGLGVGLAAVSLGHRGPSNASGSGAVTAAGSTQPPVRAALARTTPQPSVRDFRFEDVQPVDTGFAPNRRFFVGNIMPEGLEEFLDRTPARAPAPTAEPRVRFHLEQIRTVNGAELVSGF